jgi:hypothetical protein
MPQYLANARQYVATGHITDLTYPVEYAWLVGLSLRAFGERGPEIMQAALYLGLVLSLWALARSCGARPRYALIAALIAAAYPQLPVSITKVWDVNFAVLLMVVFMLLLVLLARHGPRPWLILTTALVFGLNLAQRSNMLLMFPLPAWLCLRSVVPYSPAAWLRKLTLLLSAAAVSVLTFAAVNTLAHGSFFLPQNGPYNLVQGHNEYSIPAMFNDLTCEPSVGMIMKADGIYRPGFSEGDPDLKRYFIHRTFTYIRAHPLQELKLSAVKLWTLLRPNTRMHPGISSLTIPIVAMSLIFPAWVFLVVRRKLRTGLDLVDDVFILATALYVLPFILTASDPRYQIPLEICLLAHMAAMVRNRPPAPAPDLL